MPETKATNQAQAGGGPKPADPCVLVIFGAGGDLTKRLLVPALYHLRRSKATCPTSSPSSP